MAGVRNVKKQDNEEYMEIDLILLVKTLWRHAMAILLAMLLCAGIGASLACWVIPAKYQASALLYVNNSSFSVGNTSISLSDLSASQTLVDTYIAILNTRLTLNDVIEQAKVEYTFEELEKMIEARSVNGTEIFEVTVTSKDPEEAERIANTIVKVLPEKIAQVMDGSSVRTVDLAVVPERPCSPSLLKYTVSGALIGLLFSCGIVVLQGLLDEQIRSEDELLRTYDLPVLAVIPDMLAAQAEKSCGPYHAKTVERKKGA